jgi:flagella basal body P-ring formation protein FlgA
MALLRDAVAGALILVVACGAADLTSQPGGLETQIARHVAAKLPEGAILDSVHLDCTVKGAAALTAVAPGVRTLVAPSFMVEIKENGKPRFCGASVEAKRAVLFAAHDIPEGARVKASDFVARPVDAFTGAPGALSSFDFSRAVKAGMPIPKGDPLYPGALRRTLAVGPGQNVAVLVKDGPVELRTTLRSESAGLVGDAVTLVNPDTGKTISATITGPKAAEIDVK